MIKKYHRAIIAHTVEFRAIIAHKEDLSPE